MLECIFCYLPAANTALHRHKNSQKMTLDIIFSCPSATQPERKLYLLLPPNENLSKSRNVRIEYTPRWMLLLKICACNSTCFNSSQPCLCPTLGVPLIFRAMSPSGLLASGCKSETKSIDSSGFSRHLTVVPGSPYIIFHCYCVQVVPYYLFYAITIVLSSGGGEGTSVRARNAPALCIRAGGKFLASGERFSQFLGQGWCGDRRDIPPGPAAAGAAAPQCVRGELWCVLA